MFDLYKEPKFLVRMTVIGTGLLLCALAGNSGNLLVFGVGITMAVVGSVWGSKWQVDLLKKFIRTIYDFIKMIMRSLNPFRD